MPFIEKADLRFVLASPAANASVGQVRFDPADLRQVALDYAREQGWMPPADVASAAALLEACRRFIFDAFDQHGLDLHEDDCAMDDSCECPRVVEANRLLGGWVGR